jgi:hypothetical protein
MDFIVNFENRRTRKSAEGEGCQSENRFGKDSMAKESNAALLRTNGSVMWPSGPRSLRRYH